MQWLRTPPKRQGNKRHHTDSVATNRNAATSPSRRALVARQVSVAQNEKSNKMRETVTTLSVLALIIGGCCQATETTNTAENAENTFAIVDDTVLVEV